MVLPQPVAPMTATAATASNARARGLGDFGSAIGNRETDAINARNWASILGTQLFTDAPSQQLRSSGFASAGAANAVSHRRGQRRRNTPTTTPRSMVGLKSAARTRIGAICEFAGWKRM